MNVSAVIAIACLALPSALSAQIAQIAQSRPIPPKDSLDIPVKSRPPAGMCRVWLDDVPVAQQPAPTDCATAVRSRPAKGRVVFGDDFVHTGKDTTRKAPPFTKGFAPPKPDTKKPATPKDTLA